MPKGVFTTRFNNKQIYETSFNLDNEKIIPMNRVVVEGKILAPVTIVTEITEDFCLPKTFIHFNLCVHRVSRNKYTGQVYLKSPDYIPVRILSSDMIDLGFSLDNLTELEGMYLSVLKGAYRSTYVTDDSGNHVTFYVAASDFEFITQEECQYTNRIFLRGFICNETFDVRTTNSGPIVDLKLAVNRIEYAPREFLYKEIPTDYIQCLTWNDITDYLISNLIPGDLIDIEGRIQSRSFPTKLGIIKTIHEVSVVDMA